MEKRQISLGRLVEIFLTFTQPLKGYTRFAVVAIVYLSFITGGLLYYFFKSELISKIIDKLSAQEIYTIILLFAFFWFILLVIILFSTYKDNHNSPDQ